MSRRVVVTGLGAVTGLGVGMKPLWEGLCAGRSALRRIARFDPSGFPSRLGAEVGAGEPSGFSAKDHVPKHYRKAVKVMARDIELAVAAAKFAVEDAGLTTRGTLPEDSTSPTTYKPERVGCHIGAGLISADPNELTAAFSTARREGDRHALDLHTWGARGMENLTPLWLLKYLPNMLACHVTILHGCEGPSNTITCAEASGLLSLGESTRVIERGDADLCFSGGAESRLNLMGMLRMTFAQRVATTGDATEGAPFIRPFDLEAPGSLLGEAGGILTLEAKESADARRAAAYAEVAGVGAGHAPPPGANAPEEGLVVAIESALRAAKLNASQIDAIVPLGLGCTNTDAAEAQALRAVFGSRLPDVPLVTLTPHLGHCSAGSGSVQAAVAAMALRTQHLPARLHAGRCPDDLQAGPNGGGPATLRHVLVCTGSHCGQSAAIVLSKV